jgi:hypothetical protein
MQQVIHPPVPLFPKVAGRAIPDDALQYVGRDAAGIRVSRESNVAGVGLSSRIGTPAAGEHVGTHGLGPHGDAEECSRPPVRETPGSVQADPRQELR